MSSSSSSSNGSILSHIINKWMNKYRSYIKENGVFSRLLLWAHRGDESSSKYKLNLCRLFLGCVAVLYFDACTHTHTGTQTHEHTIAILYGYYAFDRPIFASAASRASISLFVRKIAQYLLHFPNQTKNKSHTNATILQFDFSTIKNNTMFWWFGWYCWCP